MSNLRIYLRRDVLNGSNEVTRNEFFFIPVESIQVSMTSSPINPLLPGNDTTTIFGEDSPNFIFNIGRQALQIAVKGVLQPLDTGDFPSLPTAGDIVGGGAPIATTKYYVHSGDATTGSVSDRSAQNYRAKFFEFIASQAESGFGNIRFGYGDYLGDGDYQEFLGQITSSSPVSEEAGYPDQYKYSFTFTVADSTDSTTLA